MNSLTSQRGFIASIYLYAILAIVIAGMGYALYRQIQINGEQNAQIQVQAESLKEAEKSRIAAEAAVKARDASLAATRTEINRYRSKLKALEAVNAELAAWSNTPLPAAIHGIMCELTGRGESCMPTPNPDAKPPVAGMERENERRPVAMVSGSG